MVPGDLGDHLDLGVRQPGQFAVADDVVGVEVVLAVRHDEPDVGQQGAGLQVLASGVVQPVDLRQPVEQGHGEPRDVGRVRRVVVASSHELLDAASRHVAQVVERRARRVHPADGVDEHSVAERSLAVGERFDVERRRHRFEDESAGDDDVGPRRFEPTHLCSSAGRAMAEQLLDDGLELAAGEASAVVRAQRFSARRCVGHAGDRFRRTG